MDRVQTIFRGRRFPTRGTVGLAGDFAAPSLKCAKCGGTTFIKEDDVLDVWFDSGLVAGRCVWRRGPELTWPADAYLEAVEQARGWFRLVAGMCGSPIAASRPFRSVINHGLTVDEQGRKMAKSLGNSEDAADAVNRIGAGRAATGVRLARLHHRNRAGPDDLRRPCPSRIERSATTCRFVLGNLADFDPAKDTVAFDEMLEFDRFMLARTEKLKDEVWRAYDVFDFQAAYQAMLNFIVVDLSSLYIDVCAATRLLL